MSSSRLYKVEKQRLPIHPLPSSGRALLVYQNGFGYSQKSGDGQEAQRGKKKRPFQAAKESAHLITGATLCHVVALSDKKADVLIHLDPALDPILPLYRAISHLVQLGVIKTPSFDEVRILRSFISSSVRRTYLALHLIGCVPHVTRSIPFMHFVGYANGAGLVEFEKTSLSARPAVLGDIRRNTDIKNGALARQGLFCANDSRYQNSARSFEVLPGVPAFVLQSGTAKSHGVLAFNIPLTFDFYPFRVPSAPGISINMDRDDYLTVRGEDRDGALSPITIKRVCAALYSIAEQIAQFRQKTS